ncbi:MAG: BRO family protein [Clostridium sp.]
MRKNVNDLITKEFKNKKFNNLIWKGEICWFGIEVAELFGYTGRGKALFDCIKAEGLQEGKHYKTLVGEELKQFKEVFSEVLEDIKFAPKVIVLYESGLYRFLAYTRMPLGIEFREWISSDLMPTLRRKGYYVMEDVEVHPQQIKNIDPINNESNYSKFSTEKMERYRIAFETAKMFEASIDKITKDPVYKFLCLKQIFVDAGIELPKFINEELQGFF